MQEEEENTDSLLKLMEIFADDEDCADKIIIMTVKERMELIAKPEKERFLMPTTERYELNAKLKK